MALGGVTWLVSMNVLWLVQISLPLLDTRVPSVFFVPVSELLCLPMGALLVLCAHSLLKFGNRGLSGSDCAAPAGGSSCKEPVFHRHHLQECTSSGASENKRTSPRHGDSWRGLRRLQNATFLFLASMWTTGVGMHVSAVVVQIQLRPEDPLYPLVHDHLHRLWSHNVFQSGYFGLLLLLSWSNSLQKPRKDRWFVLQILWSILMGVAYTIVAQATQTVILTTSFYIASITLVFFVIASTTKLGNLSDVFTSVAVSSISGFLAMLAYFQKNSQ